jgi:hypothetical protein
MTMFDGPGGGSWPGFGFTVDGAGCVFTDGDVAMNELLSPSIVTGPEAGIVIVSNHYERPLTALSY